MLFGFNRTGSVGALASHSFCHTFNLSQLVSGGKPQESSMSVCSCRGPLCNGLVLSSTTSSTISLLFLLIVLIITYGSR
uniref:UPAR/Ly6 domain-containing protein n=1 Tax=Heterorhabditis bacteriophora TaxID=37862 RepID=A0A1I7X6Z6_HETBA